jgi:hypothetical protein
MPITLSASERDEIYTQLERDLHAFEDLLLAVECGDFDLADRLAQALSDALLLIVDDLRWGPGPGGKVELTCPPDVLRRVFKRFDNPKFEADEEDFKLALLANMVLTALEKGNGRGGGGQG